jgi:hypothetical protein
MAPGILARRTSAMYFAEQSWPGPRTGSETEDPHGESSRVNRVQTAELQQGPRLTTPSALIPLMLSLASLALVVGYGSIVGVDTTVAPGTNRPDEGTPAHLYQLMMVAQMPVMLWFAARWLPESPKRALPILMLQIVLAGVAIGSLLLIEP